MRDRLWSNPHDQAPVMRRPAVYLLAAATVAVLGLNWPIMAEGVDLVPPLWLAAFRMGGAALVVAAVMSTRGIPRPRAADRPILWSVGLVRLALVTALVFSALEFVPPGRSSILVYTASLWTVPLAVAFLHERLTSFRIAGLALGSAGVVLLFEPWALDWSDTQVLVGLGMLLVAAVANAATTVHIRAHRWAGTPFELMPWQLGVAAVPVAILAAAIEGMPDIRWTTATVAIVAYQILLGSAFGFWGLLTISRSLPAITTNLTLMAVPVVGLLSSIAIADERLTPAVAASLVLILMGVGLGRALGPPARDPVAGSLAAGISFQGGHDLQSIIDHRRLQSVVRHPAIPDDARPVDHEERALREALVLFPHVVSNTVGGAGLSAPVRQEGEGHAQVLRERHLRERRRDGDRRDPAAHRLDSRRHLSQLGQLGASDGTEVEDVEGEQQRPMSLEEVLEGDLLLERLAQLEGGRAVADTGAGRISHPATPPHGWVPRALPST